jgi:hypothetical protein
MADPPPRMTVEQASRLPGGVKSESKPDGPTPSTARFIRRQLETHWRTYALTDFQICAILRTHPWAISRIDNPTPGHWLAAISGGLAPMHIIDRSPQNMRACVRRWRNVDYKYLVNGLNPHEHAKYL